MELFAIIADIVGIISFIVSIITLINTFGIRKKIISHVEKSSFMNDIDDIVKTLKGYKELFNDISSCNRENLNKVFMILDNITIKYETVISKEIKTDIDEYKKSLKTRYMMKVITISETNECVRKLNSIITKLEKEREMPR